mgnify:CR=1 FL=1
MRGQTQLEPIAYLPKNFRNSYSVQRQSPDLKLVDQKYEDAQLMNDIQSLIREETIKMHLPTTPDEQPILRTDNTKIGGIKYSGSLN